jgi:hypothetical protein
LRPAQLKIRELRRSSFGDKKTEVPAFAGMTRWVVHSWTTVENSELAFQPIESAGQEISLLCWRFGTRGAGESAGAHLSFSPASTKAG